jgi:hypothetical protein
MPCSSRLILSLPLLLALGALPAGAQEARPEEAPAPAAAPADPAPEAAASTPAVSSTAEPEKPGFDRNALYVRGGITLSFDAATFFLTEVDTGVGVGGAIGYRLHPHVAVEGQIEWQGNQTISFLSVANVAELSRWDATGNLKLFAARGRFQPYAVAGLGYVRATGACLSLATCSGGGTIDSFLVRFGAGFDVYITRNIGLYAEGAYMWATSDIAPGEDFPDYGTLGAGVILAF